MGCLRRLSERSECVPKAMSKKRRMGCEPRVIEDPCVATKGTVLDCKHSINLGNVLQWQGLVGGILFWQEFMDF